MQWKPEARQIILSARELAEFHLGPRESGSSSGGLWRAQLGQAWHKEMEIRSAGEFPGAEVLLEYAWQFDWPWQGWTLSLQGRIDQIVLESNTVCLREVKSVRCPLPVDPAILKERYPDYFAQLAVYLAVMKQLNPWPGKSLSGQMVFVEIEDGLTQTISLDVEEAIALFSEKAEGLVKFFGARREGLWRLQGHQFPPAFAIWREGQEMTVRALQEVSWSEPFVFLEAPTGFGKTGVAIARALQLLQSGMVQRIVYLTGKSTGQTLVIETLRRMAGGSGLRLVHLQSKARHAIVSANHTCDDLGGCRKGIEEAWRRSGIDPSRWLGQEYLSIEEIRRIGAERGVCPFEITRALLPWAEVWVCDYNYIFSPRHRLMLESIPSFTPRQTLLVVDEGHNLPARAADAFSCQTDALLALRVFHELDLARAPRDLTVAWQAWLRWLQQLKACPELELPLEYDAKNLVRTVCDSLARSRLEPLEFTAIAWDALWSLQHWRRLLEYETLEKLLWAPAPGEFRCTCLDAAPEIAQQLRQFAQVWVLSATLSPVPHFRRSCGLQTDEGTYLPAHAPWREGTYRIAVDVRVDTRMKTRERYYGLTAETILLAVQRGKVPAVVFLPSYRYAEEVRARLLELSPFLHVGLPIRGQGLDEQVAFIESALRADDVILLVMGGSFAEGIDLLGGKIPFAMVVGPALPEVNAVQEARMRNRDHLDRNQAFTEVYLRPGLLKINQALGRLVRAPGQQVDVLLHCRRFAESATQQWLAPEYRGGTIVRNEGELTNWLAGIS